MKLNWKDYLFLTITLIFMAEVIAIMIAFAIYPEKLQQYVGQSCPFYMDCK